MAFRDSKREIPLLAGWTALTVAAEELGISRQWLFEQVTSAQDSGFHNVRQVKGTGDRAAVILIRTSEVTRIKGQREAASGCPQCRRIAEEAGVRPEICGHQPVVAVPEDELAAAGL
jgi:hypothetical protein